MCVCLSRSVAEKKTEPKTFYFVMQRLFKSQKKKQAHFYILEKTGGNWKSKNVYFFVSGTHGNRKTVKMANAVEPTPTMKTSKIYSKTVVGDCKDDKKISKWQNLPKFPLQLNQNLYENDIKNVTTD